MIFFRCIAFFVRPLAVSFNHVAAIFVLFVLSLSTGCLPPDEPDFSVELNLQDNLHQKIIKWQDSRLTDSLIIYLSHAETSARYNAALAFASVQDPKAIDDLGHILENDMDLEVRRVAAYALGQTFNAQATPYLQQAFSNRTDEGYDEALNGIILEAIGKTTENKSTIELIATARPYKHSETYLWRGRALALFRFLERGKYSPIAVNAAIDILFDQNLPDNARMIAAYFLSRLDRIEDPTKIEMNLPVLLNTESNVDIRAFSSLSIRHMKLDSLPSWLTAKFNAETEPAVKINLLRGTANKSSTHFLSFWLDAISDQAENVGIVASEIILQNATSNRIDTIWSIANEEVNWRTRANLAAACLQAASGPLLNDINKTIKTWYSETLNLYEKAALLRALGYNHENLQFILEPALSPQISVIRTTATEAVLKITGETPYSPIPRNMAFMNFISESLLAILELHDPAIQSRFAISILDNHTHLLRIDNLEKKLLDARATLNLPRDVQAYNDLSRAIYHLQGLPDYKPLEVKDSRPIDWNEVNRLRQFEVVNIITNRGTIVVQLNWQNAPLTCVNFLKLAERSFYDNKVFHRVVPNFVIQGGCSRGDGWGSEDYTIRSELGLEYFDRPGFIGMASAGKDTENVQFFITQMPAPHLDGRYTIFGHVISGMNFVNETQVGDRINKIELLQREAL